jgi:hypothetical protein
MSDSTTPLPSIEELEVRQNKVLRELDLLNRRIERVLRDQQPKRPAASHDARDRSLSAAASVATV